MRNYFRKNLDGERFPWWLRSLDSSYSGIIGYIDYEGVVDDYNGYFELGCSPVCLII